MSELARLGLVLLTGLMEAFTNWMETKERKNREDHVADVRANPATHWMRRFGGTDNRAPASSPDTGGHNNE